MAGLIERMVDQQAKKFDEKMVEMEKRMNARFDDLSKKMDKILENDGRA